MNDEYEIFDNDDVSETDENTENKKSFLNKSLPQSISIIMMLLILVVCVVNLAMCLDLYSKYNNVQIEPENYFQNNGYINTENNIVVENAGDEIVEITTGEQAELTVAASTSVSQSAVQTSSTASSAVPTAVALVNINTATIEELTALSGIGEKKAQAIIDYRTENGRFNSVEELTNVSGIGEKTLEKNIDKITVD